MLLGGYLSNPKCKVQIHRSVLYFGLNFITIINSKVGTMKKIIEAVQCENKKLEAKIKTTISAFKCDECDHQATSTGDLRRHFEKSHNLGNLSNLVKLKEQI